MNITTMHPEHADQLLAIYVAQVAHAPHCRFAPDQAGFTNDLLGHVPRSAHLYRTPEPAHMLVAEAAGSAQGFATVATYRDSEDQAHQAITGLFFTHESAGHALLEAYERQSARSELEAFPATHGNTLIQTYNAGWDGLSDRIPNVARVLTQHGYIPYQRELHLSARIEYLQTETKSLPPPIRLRLPEAPADHRGAQRIQALDSHTEIGVCEYYPLAVLTNTPAASQTGYIGWLHVNDTFRRRGIARVLMSAAIAHLRQQGCNECWLTTAADNWGAQALYLSLGFEVVDCSTSFRKKRDS